jgi:periplasmic divalent cation tolerance protein
MKPKYAVVLVTAPNLKAARTLARATLKAQLAACVNLVPALESHYWWQGQLESGREILLLIKTTHALLPALELLILKLHPYDTPEFLALPVTHGSRRYLDWIDTSIRTGR